MKLIFSNLIRNEEGEGGGGGSLLASEPVVEPAVQAEPQAPVEPAPAEAPSPENWKMSLPEELRNEPSLGPVNDIPTLVKNYVNAQKQMGKDKVTLPGKHGTDDDWRQVYHKLGLPEDIKGYEVDVPKDAEFQDGFITQLKEVAFKQGVLPKQLSGILDWYNGANKEAVSQHESQQQEALEKRMAEYRAEVGEAFNKHVNLAKNALTASGLGDNVFSWLNETGLGDDPMMIKLLAAIGEKFLGEDQIVGGQEHAGSKAPQEIQKEINEILGNREHPAHNKAHPNHQNAIKELEELHRRLYPAQ